MKSGIYAIVNERNNKVYVGQSIDISKRWKQHQKELANGTHHNKGLQNDYNKGDKFRYQVLAYGYDLDDLERHYIQKYNSYHRGYNETRGGSGQNYDPLNVQTTSSSDGLLRCIVIIVIIFVIALIITLISPSEPNGEFMGHTTWMSNLLYCIPFSL